MKAIIISLVIFFAAANVGFAQTSEESATPQAQIEKAEAPAPVDGTTDADAMMKKHCGSKSKAMGCCSSKAKASAGCGGEANAKKSCCAKGHAEAAVKEEDEQK